MEAYSSTLWPQFECAVCKGLFLFKPAKLILQDVNCNVSGIKKTLILALTRYLVTQFCTLRKKQKNKTTPEKQSGNTLEQTVIRLQENPCTHNNTLTMFCRIQVWGQATRLCLDCRTTNARSLYSLDIYYCMWSWGRSVPNQRPLNASNTSTEQRGMNLAAANSVPFPQIPAARTT